MRSEYAQNVLNEIYSDGDINLVFFQHLLSWVSFDMNTDGDEDSFGKTDKQCKDDVLILIKYLVQDQNDFRIMKGVRFEDNSFGYLCVAYDEFSLFIEKIVSSVGIKDFESTVSLGLQKLHEGQSAPAVIPNDIVALFQHVSVQ